MKQLDRIIYDTRLRLNERFKARGWPAIEIGVGVNTGPMRVGDMGSKLRKAYTVMSDAVNLASRLEGLTKSGRSVPRD